jgi:hypothetical protein
MSGIQTSDNGAKQMEMRKKKQKKKKKKKKRVFQRCQMNYIYPSVQAGLAGPPRKHANMRCACMEEQTNLFFVQCRGC